MLDALYDLLAHYATWPTVALLAVVSIVCAVRLSKLVKAFGHNKLLDLRFFYSAEDARDFLDAIGEGGRRAYVRTAFTWDMIYPVAYGTLFATLLVHLYSPERGRVWVLIPLLAALADLLENFTVAHLAWHFKGQASSLTAVATTCTMLKWLLIGLTLFLLLIGAVQSCFFMVLE